MGDIFRDLIARAKEHVQSRRETIKQIGNHSWEWDGKNAWGILCDLAAIELGPECTCDGGPQGDGLCELPHDPSCPVDAWQRRPLP